MKSSIKLRALLARVGFVSLLSIMLFSCLKDHNDYVVTPTALLMVVQGSPDAPAEDLYLNNNRVTAQAFYYQDRVGYFNVYTGKRTIILNSFGTQSLIASDTITINANNAYSVFLANTYTKPDFIAVNDSIARPASGMATLRLVNASPDAGAVDLVANSTVLASNKAYKGASGFATISGGTSYTIQVRKAGTTTVLASKDTTFKVGGVYTLWLHGLAAGTGATALKAGVIGNAYY
jgi:hypothetical protein